MKNGYNFSNIKKASLDILLEELKNSVLTKDKIEKSESKVLEILQNEQVIKTLYTPKITLLIDKNLKNTQLKESIPNITLRSEILNNSYILDKKVINFKNKSFINFVKFIIKMLHE